MKGRGGVEKVKNSGQGKDAQRSSEVFKQRYCRFEERGVKNG